MVAVFAVVTPPSWALPISEFLENGVLPMDEIEARQVQHRASAYSIINNELTKHSSTGVFQCYIEQDKARPIKKLDGPTAVRFVKDIAVRYGMPNSIITDNGTNFAKGALAQYCSSPASASTWLSLHIRSPTSLCTTPNRSTGFTPFFLVYGAEVVIPTDVEFDSPRVTMYTEAEAKEARKGGIDLLEEACLLALSRSAIYQQGLGHYHNKKIKPLAFREGDLVLRLVQEQTGQHKLSPPPWEGPFIVSKALCDRNTYYLFNARKSNKRKRDTTGKETTRPWNAELLRRVYN
ncbi:uncharacterized protein [Aegilops tauschii subsp. strangulata]|uniref:uncharacterized protein n=1 Tax=Aegilops tauschii subsp. strangulata TaxID=200361 RepID=UPI003CC8C5B7